MEPNYDGDFNHEPVDDVDAHIPENARLCQHRGGGPGII